MDTGQNLNTGNKGVLTPEQLAQLQKHKTSAPTPQQATPREQTAVNQNVPPNIRNRHFITSNTQPEQTVQSPQAQPTVEVSEEENAYFNSSSVETKRTNGETYFRYQDDEGGMLEVDLVTFREKGRETRYLSLALHGYDMSQNPPIPQKTFLSIGSKEAFEKVKEFFSNLNWED